jgi:predicted nucleic acid-binding protein
MRSYFVDTWYLIALFDRTDEHHRATRAIARRVERLELISHDGVLTEFLAYLAGYGAYNRHVAVDFVRRFMRRALVLPADRDLFLSGLDLYDRRLDNEYSLVDCMSMVLMRDHSLTHVLTNDHHFRQEGFTVVNE